MLILGVFGSSETVAGADPSSNVLVTATVYSSGGTSTDSVTVAVLEANPGQCPTYQAQTMNELGRQGWVSEQLSPDATWTLPTILGCLQTPISVGAVSGITVINGDGSPELDAGSQLTPADLAASGSDFNDASEYPVMQALGSFNEYDRPWRGSPGGQPDYNFLDEVQESQSDQPAPIAIEVFEGPHLNVTATASPTTVPVGGNVSFSATATGANDGGLSYSWNFDGGAANSTAPTPQATFNIAGQYDVTLQVTDSAGGGGGAEIPITVGSPAPAGTGGHNQTGSGTSRKSHSPTGTRTRSGNHVGAPGGTYKSPSSSAGKTGTTSTSPTSTAPSTTPATTSPTPGASNHPAAPTSAPTSRATRSPPPHGPRHTSPITKPPPRTHATGPLVSGQLISDVRTLPPGASPLVQSAQEPTASALPARQAVRTLPVPALTAALSIAVLLGLGAGRELRGRRGWHAMRPGG